ncbi:MAG: metal-dependent hydrolase [Candidatus Micrarchaeota archaeon]
MHFVTAVVFFSPLAFALFSGVEGSLALFLLFMAGALAGVLMPDSDVAGARGDARFGLFVSATRWALFKPLSLALRLAGFRRAGDHRGVMHSYAGLVAGVALWFAAAAVVSLAFSSAMVFALAFASGIALGYAFHLFEDSLTVTGVRWLFPKGFLLKGRISLHYSSLHEKRFRDSESYAALLFVAAAIINAYLFLFAGTTALSLALISIFELSIIAAACRLEAVEY